MLGLFLTTAAHIPDAIIDKRLWGFTDQENRVQAKNRKQLDRQQDHDNRNERRKKQQRD